MKLPFLISVPHAGLHIPQEAQDICILTSEDIYADSDGGAAEVYFDLEKVVEAFCSSDVARAIVDLNRAADDFSKDGVIKTRTCYDVQVYKDYPSQVLIDKLLANYYQPYHQKLESLFDVQKIKVGIDCHTMAAVGPPVGPDAGKERPLVCISNADGTCPDEWLKKLANCFQKVFSNEQVNINLPFKGGYIIRHHSKDLPWLQIELSRTESISNSEKRSGVIEALNIWNRMIFI